MLSDHLHAARVFSVAVRGACVVPAAWYLALTARDCLIRRKDRVTPAERTELVGAVYDALAIFVTLAAALVVSVWGMLGRQPITPQYRAFTVKATTFFTFFFIPLAANVAQRLLRRRKQLRGMRPTK